jgi:penicillin-binding protein 2
VAIAGLDSGVITPGSRVFDPGYYELPNYDHKYRNWNRSGDGWVDMYTAIMRSNDTYFYDLAHKLGIDRLRLHGRIRPGPEGLAGHVRGSPRADAVARGSAPPVARPGSRAKR